MTANKEAPEDNRWPVDESQKRNRHKRKCLVALLIVLLMGSTILASYSLNQDDGRSASLIINNKSAENAQWLLFEDNDKDRRLLVALNEDLLSSVSDEDSLRGPHAAAAAKQGQSFREKLIDNFGDLKATTKKTNKSSDYVSGLSRGTFIRASRQRRLAPPDSKTRSRRSLKRIERRVERKPILNEFSFPANLVQGMRFVLMCQVLDGDGPIQIKWLKDNQELNFDFGKQQQPEDLVELLAQDELGSSLLFRHVKYENGGNYTCIATNPFGSTSYSSIMSVKVRPKWKVEPQDQESIMGEQIVIDCQATGNPNPFIRWKFASNMNQQRQYPAALDQTLNLLATGQQQQQQQQQQATSSALIDLSQLDGLANNNFKLLNSNHHVQTLENGSLSIRQASKQDHEGFYMCEADNGIEPNLVKILKLIVHLQAQFLDEIQMVQDSSQLNTFKPTSPNQPTISSQQTTAISSGTIKTIKLAQNTTQLRLLCQPFGDLPLTLDWLKDGQLIYTYTSPLDHSQPARLSTATSTQLQSDLASRYHLNTRKGAKSMWPSSSSTSNVVQLDSELIVTNLKRSDAGLYTCLARNSYGQNEKKLRLVIQEVPEAPEVIDVAHIGSRSIGLRWLAPFDGNSPIVKYLVESRQISDSMEQNPVQSVGENLQVSEKVLQVAKDQTGQQPTAIQQQVQHSLHDLEPLTRYSIRVIAVNSIGKSRPSISLSLKTEEEVPSVVPNPVRASVISSRSIKLHWTISYSPEHEIIEGFFVGYRSFDSSGAVLNDPRSASLNNDQQPTFTYKTIRLTSQRQRQQDQQLVIDSIPNSSGGNNFNQDSLSAFLAPISSITKSLPMTKGDSQFSQKHQVVVINNFEYIINGLERNTEYSILIQCFNKKGAGPTSDPVVFKTFVNDPPEKLILSAEEITESSLKIGWRFLLEKQAHPLIKGGESNLVVDGFVLTFAKTMSNQIKAIRSNLADPVMLSANKSADHQAAARISSQGLEPKIVSISAATSLDQWQSIQLAGPQRSHQLKNLECGTMYAMKIYAFNKVGKGEPSDLLTISTKGRTPIAPDRRSFLSINSTQVRLHLNAWSDGGCEIEKFIIQYKLRGQLDWILVSNNIFKEQISVLIKDLLPATSYELLIIAQNQVGPSETKYKFTTLDSEGKPVGYMNSLFGHSAGNSDYLSPEDEYLDDPDGSLRRNRLWPTTESFRFMRLILNSPLALFVLFCSLATLMLVIMFYKFNNKSSSSSSSSSHDIMNHQNNGNNTNCSSSNKSSSRFGSSTMTTRRGSLGEGNATILDGCEGPLSSLANDSFTDSPRLNLQRLNANSNPYPTISECHYQSFCNNNRQSALLPTQSADYDNNYVTSATTLAAAAAAAVSNYGQAQQQPNYALNNPMTNYASVQRSATMDACNPNNSLVDQTTPLMSEEDQQQQHHQQQQQQQQRCLMQMLMLNPQNQSDNLDQRSYVAAALTTLARGKAGGLKQQGHNLVSNGFSSTTFNPRIQLLDYHRHQQMQQQQVNGANEQNIGLTEIQN